MWETHETWSNTISSSWTTGGTAECLEDLRAKLIRVARQLGSWNRNTFGIVRKEIKSLKLELERLRSIPDRTAPTHVELKINEKLVELYHREELMWRQRARLEWLSAGDRNTRFFHLRASQRRKRNMIKALANSLGVLTEDPGELKALVNDFYKSLYTSEGVAGMDDVLSKVLVKVTD